MALFFLSPNYIIAHGKATLSDFVGAWEFVTTPPRADAPPMPFLSTLKVFDANQDDGKETDEWQELWHKVGKIKKA